MKGPGSSLHTFRLSPALFRFSSTQDGRHRRKRGVSITSQLIQLELQLSIPVSLLTPNCQHEKACRRRAEDSDHVGEGGFCVNVSFPAAKKKNITLGGSKSSDAEWCLTWRSQPIGGIRLGRSGVSIYTQRDTCLLILVNQEVALPVTNICVESAPSMSAIRRRGITPPWFTSISTRT